MSEEIKDIQVLGSGCPSCKKLHELTEQAAAEMGLDIKVDYDTDISKIIEMGVMTSPVLAVNGRPVLTGKVADVKTIIEAIRNRAD